MDAVNFEEGFIYGHAPPQPQAVPDIEGMLEAAGVPTGEGLPHPLEWYANAKDREKERRRQIDELSIQSAELRQEWASLVCADLGDWQRYLSNVCEERDPLPGLAVLLARAVHERPGDAAGIGELYGHVEKATARRQVLGNDLEAVGADLQGVKDLLQAQAAEQRADEEARLVRKRAEDARRARAERALRRNEARLRGEAVSDSDGEADAEGAEPSQDVAGGALEQMPQAQRQPWVAAPAPGPGLPLPGAVQLPGAVPLGAASPPAALRSGPGRGLPPLVDAPLPAAARTRTSLTVAGATPTALG